MRPFPSGSGLFLLDNLLGFLFCDFFPLTLLADVREFFHKQETQFRPAKVGQASAEQRVPEIRSDMTYWLDRQRDAEMK